jgi:NCAIR mutase (PurE)-related protein
MNQNADEIQRIWDALLEGRLDMDELLARLKQQPTSDLDFATVDIDRQRRCGFPEVILGTGKTPEWIEGVARRLIEAGQSCLATRVNDEQAAHLSRVFPEAEQDRVARTFWLKVEERGPLVGHVSVITAGTGDLPVAREALVTVGAMGVTADLIVDVGVAGLHRLLRQYDRFRSADAIVVAAGMDGALPSVVGGLVDCPVFAVPTSIGYGTSFGGLAALLTMLNACSANVAVVNIDAGFKAGYLAALVARGKHLPMQL